MVTAINHVIKTSEGDKYRISSIRRCGYYLFWCLFCAANIYFAACWLLLFEGSVYFFQELRIAWPLSRAATIRGWRLFEEILYVVKADLQISWFCCKCFFYKPRLRDYPLCVLHFLFVKLKGRCTFIVSVVLLLIGVEKKMWSITRLYDRGDRRPPWLLLFIVLHP